MSADVLLQLFGDFLYGGWWQDLHSGHRKTLHSAKHKTKKFLKTHSVGVPFVQLPFAGQLTG